MLKRWIAVILLACVLMCSLLTACEPKTPEQEVNPIYTEYNVNTEGDPLIVYTLGLSIQASIIIEKYNKHCAIYDNYDNRIELVNFYDFEKFNSAITTELMAGKGPDLFLLSTPVPFEKMVENGSLLDINKLLEEYDSDINFDDYNKVIMDSGVFDGKRYILPAFYCIDTMFSTQDRLDALGIDTNTITYEKLAEMRAAGTPFIFTENTDRGEERTALNLLVHMYADFEEKKTYFDTEEFSSALDALTTLYADGQDIEEDFMFENTDILTKSTHSYCYYGASPVAVAERFITQQEQSRELVFFPSYSRDDTVSAYIEMGIAVNANTTKTDKAMKFIEFLLSDNTQEYHCGALRKDRTYTQNTCSLPVKNSALDKAFQVELEDVYYSDIEDPDPELLDFYSAVNEKKNTFLSEEYRPLVDSVSSCTLYSQENIYLSYYSRYIADDIIQEYMDGTITKDKLIARLESATRAYMTE